MRSLLEQAVVHILNGNQDKAEALFHKFMVERARTIHESLRQGDDVQLNEGWDTEIAEEEYFDDLDAEEGDGTDVEGGGEFGGEPAMDAPMGDELGMEGPPMDDVEGEPGDELGDDLGAEDDLEGMGGEPDIETKLDDIEAKMDELSAQFDQLMASVDGGGEGDLDDMGMGDEGDLDDMDMGDEGGDDVMDMSDETPGEETNDLADRFEDDMGDDEQPEEEMAEGEDFGSDDSSDNFSGDDDEMMEDITESVLAELDKVAAVSNTEGKEIGSGGKTASPRKEDALPHHGVQDRVNQAKPVMVKAQGDAHNDSFERETPPTNKTIEKRRNNDAGVKKLKTVPAKGDASANLNSDFAGGIKATNPIIDGKKGIK